ncbi:MAG: rhodanese-like domain-containing protein [Actinomycetes bacterium]
MPTHVPGRVDAATVLRWTALPGTAVVLDVRTPAEFGTAHLTGSYSVPLDLLSEHAEEFAAHLDRPVVLICQSGVRAEQAAQRLAGVGLANLHILDAIGAGLTFSALTNSCAMGAVLGRLPYNRGPAAPTRHDVVAQLRPAIGAA